MSFLGDLNPVQYSPGGSKDPFDVFQTNQNSKFHKPDVPTPPDYKALIDEQAKVNRINQNTPFGSLQFTTDKNGNTVANYNLSPQYQKMSNMLLRQLGGSIGGAPQYDRRLTKQYFNDTMKLLNPQLQQQQAQFTQNLADRGLPAGSQLGDSLTQQFNQGQNDARLQAAQQAIQQGLAYGQFGQTRQQGLAQLFNQFTPGLNGFFSPSGIDVNGSQSLSQNAANQNYQQLMNAYSANQQGLYGLGSAGIGALFGGA